MSWLFYAIIGATALLAAIVLGSRREDVRHERDAESQRRADRRSAGGPSSLSV
jgi:hypothetical protein